MKRIGSTLAVALIVTGSATITASAQSTETALGAGPNVQVFTRTIGGREVKEAYIIIDRTEDASDRSRRSGKFLPRCRRGLFGRVTNKTPCKGRRRSGGVSDGERY